MFENVEYYPENQYNLEYRAKFPAVIGTNYAYALLDPDTKEARYVGITRDIYARYQGHLRLTSLKTNTPKNRWIKELLAQGKKPIMKILETVHGHIGHLRVGTAERKWLRHYKELGCNMLNCIPVVK